MKRQHVVPDADYTQVVLWIYLPCRSKAVYDNRNHHGLAKCLNALDGIAIQCEMPSWQPSVLEERSLGYPGGREPSYMAKCVGPVI